MAFEGLEDEELEDAAAGVDEPLPEDELLLEEDEPPLEDEPLDEVVLDVPVLPERESVR